jgi:hypothetical protein
MGKYKNKEVTEALNYGHFRFAAKFTWTQSSDSDAAARFKRFLEFVGNEHEENEHTGIQKKTLQGYYLSDPDGGPERIFVIIGLQNPLKKKGRYGLEEYCSKLIYGTEIKVTFGHPVEASELELVHGKPQTG